MNVLIILLIASLSVSVIFLLAFIWSVKNRQFEDQYSSSMRILFEDQPGSAEKSDELQVTDKTSSKLKYSENPSDLN